MVQNIVLEAKKRIIVGKKVSQLLSTGMVPAVMYGHGFDNVLVSVDAQQFRKVFAKSGYNTVISLQIEGEACDVLVHDVTLNPVTDNVVHIDFLRIRKDQKIETAIPIVIVGESTVVKDLGGSLIHELDEIEVRCLPKDLIEKFEIDISTIQEFNTPIRVKDLKIPATLEVLTDMEGMIVTIVPPRKEEEAPAATDAIPADLKAQQEAAAASKVDPEKEKKKDK